MTPRGFSETLLVFFYWVDQVGDIYDKPCFLWFNQNGGKWREIRKGILFSMLKLPPQFSDFSF